MKFLKNLALSLLSLLLFLSLSIFGLMFMINQTALNPNFIISELNRLDISSLVKETIIIEQPSSGDLPTQLVSIIPQIEPLVKEKTGVAIHSVYDYLLGKSPNIDLALTLRNSLLSKDFAISVVDKLDISSLASDFLRQEFIKQIPAEMRQYITSETLDKVISKLKPLLVEQINTAADPILDYVVGKRQSFNIVISLEPAKTSLEGTLREAFLKSPPPELAGVPQAELERYFDQFYGELAAQMPSTLEINQSILGTNAPAKITQALTETEQALKQARKFISLFQLIYKALIGFMVLAVLCIILLRRQVKSATRGLGTTFLTYGAFEYAGIFVAKYFVGTKLPLLEIPPSLQTWMPQFFDNLLAPLEMFSLSLLIGGIALIIVSFVYKSRQPSL